MSNSIVDQANQAFASWLVSQGYPMPAIPTDGSWLRYYIPGFGWQSAVNFTAPGGGGTGTLVPGAPPAVAPITPTATQPTAQPHTVTQLTDPTKPTMNPLGIIPSNLTIAEVLLAIGVYLVLRVPEYKKHG